MIATVVDDAFDSLLSLGPCPVIRSARLLLRPHKLSDADAIAASLSDFKVSRMLARVPQPYDRQDAIEWLMRQAAAPAADWNLAITCGDDLHIGAVGIEQQSDGWHLGYWLNRAHWDHGYMSEAVRGALSAFFAAMPEATIHSGAFADNLASLNVQKKLGFRITGTDEIFCLARNRMVPQIVTTLDKDYFLLSGAGR
jgi:RimJ/RimL family protein N-acetyltransferase